MTGPPPAAPIRIAPIDAPTREGVKPLPPAEQPVLEPYRVLFPLGAAYAILGVLPWVARAFVPGPWPALVHAALMVEGFELAFAAGFLLTAMPAFTHGAKARPWELAGAALGVAAFGTLRMAGLEAAAHAVFAATLAFTALAIARRLRFGQAAPPEEFALVGVGVLFGITGGVAQALAAAGLVPEPAFRFGLRLVARGMMLAFVLGLGGLLVPTFAMVPDPLRIAGIARAGQRGPRRAFLAALALALAGAIALETAGHDAAGAWLRLAAGAASTLLAWKLWRFPGRRDRLSWSLWSAGALVLLGLAFAALLPAHAVAAWHVVFVGGYGLLTLAIGTRVVVSHGGHDPRDEAKVLGAAAVAALAVALAVRAFSGEADPRRLPFLAAAAALWSVTWTFWLLAALPRIRKTRRALLMPSAPGK